MKDVHAAGLNNNVAIGMNVRGEAEASYELSDKL